MEFAILALTLENTILLHTKYKGIDQPVRMYSKTCLKWPLKKKTGVQWLIGRVLDSRPKGCGFETHLRHCVVSLSKNINPSLVLAQPRKTRPYITGRLLMGLKKSSQTNKKKPKIVFKTDYCLMKIKSITECILQYF